MANKNSPIARIFMLDEQSVFRPILAGFLIGAAVTLMNEVSVAAAVGGGIGGAILFAVVWKVARIARKEN